MLPHLTMHRQKTHGESWDLDLTKCTLVESIDRETGLNLNLS